MPKKKPTPKKKKAAPAQPLLPAMPGLMGPMGPMGPMAGGPMMNPADMMGPAPAPKLRKKTKKKR